MVIALKNEHMEWICYVLAEGVFISVCISILYIERSITQDASHCVVMSKSLRHAMK